VRRLLLAAGVDAGPVQSGRAEMPALDRESYGDYVNRLSLRPAA
jgi:hypothetical protein